MNNAHSRSSTPGTEPLCIIRFIAESGYSALQIDCDGRVDGCRRSQRRGRTRFVAAILLQVFHDVSNAGSCRARLVAPDSGPEITAILMSGSVLAAVWATALARLKPRNVSRRIGGRRRGTRIVPDRLATVDRALGRNSRLARL